MSKELTAMQMLIDEMESEFKHANTWSVKKVDIYRGLQKPNPFYKKNKSRLNRLLMMGIQMGWGQEQESEN